MDASDGLFDTSMENAEATVTFPTPGTYSIKIRTTDIFGFTVESNEDLLLVEYDPTTSRCTGTAGYWLNHPCVLDPIFTVCGPVSVSGLEVISGDQARVVLAKGACDLCEKKSGKKTTTYENPLNQLYRQTLSAQLAINNCIDGAADPTSVQSTLKAVEDFLDETPCPEGCLLDGDEKRQVSAWNTILNQFNSGTLIDGPLECSTFPCL